MLLVLAVGEGDYGLVGFLVSGWNIRGCYLECVGKCGSSNLCTSIV